MVSNLQPANESSIERKYGVIALQSSDLCVGVVALVVS